MLIKVIAFEFNEECASITNETPESIDRFSLDEIELSDKSPDFDKMLCVLNGTIKDFCNRKFAKTWFYAPIFIFITTGPTDKKYLNALSLLNNNRIYLYGTKIGFVIGENANVETIADIFGSEEAVVTTSNLGLFDRLFRFKEVEVDPLVE